MILGREVWLSSGTVVARCDMGVSSKFSKKIHTAVHVLTH